MKITLLKDALNNCRFYLESEIDKYSFVSIQKEAYLEDTYNIYAHYGEPPSNWINCEQEGTIFFVPPEIYDDLLGSELGFVTFKGNDGLVYQLLSKNSSSRNTQT